MKSKKMTKEHHRSITGPLILIVIGVIFLASNVGWISHGFGQLWPLILIAIGVGSIWKAYQK